MAIIDAAYLDTIATSARIVDLADDDADGEADTTVLIMVLTAAIGRFEGAARRGGFPLPIDETDLVASAKTYVGWYALGLLGRRRPEYRDLAGRFPYHLEFTEAEQYFTRLATGGEILYPAREDAEVEAGLTRVVVASRPRRGW